MTDSAQDESLDPLIPITSPRDGLPTLVESDRALESCAHSLRNGGGPVAIDAERASGFRYGQRAYLIQLRRPGSGTHLIDPTCFSDLSVLQDALKDVDWILHAASQDLVCLAEVGLFPTALLFDTELAGRLLGLPKVGLGTLVETELGFQLAKEHSAADWSQRPLPNDWLNYAALDVEFLHELWEILETKLKVSGKFDYALEEFAHVRDNTTAVVRSEPWRRTSGLHGARKPRQLAIVRSLWELRDSMAQKRDIAPGRILPDSAIISIAHEVLESTGPLEDLAVFNTRLTARNRSKWISATQTALALPDEDLPATKVLSSGPPAPRMWQERNPQAFARLEQVRSELSAISEKFAIPIENLMTPDTVRRLLWNPVSDESALQEALIDFGARNWQRELVGPVLARALFEPLISTELSDLAEH